MDSSSRIDIIHHMCRVRVRVRLVLIIMRYSVVLISLLLSALPPSLCQPPRSNYTSVCSQPYKCGEHPELYYPFWGRGDNVRPAFCGGGDQFKLTCEEMDQPSYGGNGASTYYTSFIEMGSQKFEVSDIDPTAYTMKMVPMGEGPDVVCSPDFNFSLSPVFRYDQIVHNITVILISDCPRGVSPSGDGKNFTCHDGVAVLYYYDEGGKEEVLKQHPELDGCGRIMEMPAEAVDVARHGGDAVDALQGALGEGFNVRYSVSEECMRCAGSKEAWCGSNDESEFTCYCPHNRFSARNCFGHAPPPATAPPPAHAPAAAPPPAHAPAAAHKSMPAFYLSIYLSVPSTYSILLILITYKTFIWPPWLKQIHSHQNIIRYFCVSVHSACWLSFSPFPTKTQPLSLTSLERQLIGLDDSLFVSRAVIHGWKDESF